MSRSLAAAYGEAMTETTSTPVSRFPIGSLDDLPADLRARVQEVADSTGFLPNVFVSLLHEPAQLAAFMDFHEAVMEKPTGLSKADREMVVVATSAANDCLYCIVAHGAILRIRAKDPEITDRVAANYRTAPVSPKQRAMLDVAVRMARVPEEVGEADFAQLRDAGFTEAEIWDLGMVVAFFALSNRMAHLMNLQPNPEFFLMGRLPREKS